MKWRPFFFWFHLSLGLTAGLVIIFLAFTGFLLSFEPQMISFSERALKTVPVSGPRLSLDALAAKVREAAPDQEITGLTFFRDADSSLSFSLGHNGILYVNPYTGGILGAGAGGLRAFFETVTDLHRWFGFQGKDRDAAKTVKGVCVLLFGLSVISGFCLWWPRRWTASVFKVIGIPAFRFKGKQREFNWHNAVGFWSAPWLMIIIVTGLIMIYPLANDLLYRVMGSEPPPRPVAAAPPAGASAPMEMKKSAHHEKHKNKVQSAGFDAYFAAVEKQAPDWISVNIRLPQGNRPNVMAVIETPSSPNAYGRSLLTLDQPTAQMIKWEPYEADSLGRKARIWVRALHTGEAGGLIGQVIAALAVLGAMIQVWTGFSLSCRRFLGK
jgi:uncharacterized iron-regulated membrane protein